MTSPTPDSKPREHRLRPVSINVLKDTTESNSSELPPLMNELGRNLNSPDSTERPKVTKNEKSKLGRFSLLEEVKAGRKQTLMDVHKFEDTKQLENRNFAVTPF